jgi:hypothetical protein
MSSIPDRRLWGGGGARGPAGDGEELVGGGARKFRARRILLPDILFVVDFKGQRKIGKRGKTVFLSYTLC